MSTAVKKCTVGELEAALGEAGCQIVDVREPAEFRAERIPGTRLAPLSSLSEHARHLDAKRPVYVVCRSGNRAGKAAEQLRAFGYSDVRVVEGGLLAWSAAGKPTEKKAGGVWALDRQVRFTAGLLSFIGSVLAALVHPGFLLLPGIVGAGLAFSAATDTCAMGTVLARMPWNQARQS